MEGWKFRSARYVSRVMPLPLIRALVRYAPRFLRTRIWNYACDDQALSVHHHFTVSTKYGKFTGDSSDMLSQYVYFFGFWEPLVSRLIRERLSAGQTFVDVGANTGWYTVLAAQTVGPTGRVTSIEASATNFLWLKENVRTNGLGNVRLVNEAAWSSESELSLFQGPPSHSGVSTVVASFAEDQHCDPAGWIRARPLSSLLNQEEISTVRVLKIDVEGAELEVIKGLEPVLDSAPNNMEVFLELNPHQYDVNEILLPFRRRGFRAYIVPNEYGARSYLNVSQASRVYQFEELLTVPKGQVDVLLTRNQP
jgi:FkbM family methyltransferase